MKRNEIVVELNKINELTKAGDMHTALTDLITRLNTAKDTPEGKLVHYVHVREAKQEANVKYPTQLLQVHAALWGASEQGARALTREECVKACEDAGTIVTRQSIERIFAFYQKRMEDDGWISRETIRE